MAKNSIKALKPNVLQGKVVSPIKTKEITDLIKRKQYVQPSINLKQGIHENPVKINTINGKLNGTIHKESGIPFRNKKVITGEGKIVKGVFPDFREVSVHTTTLPNHLIKAPTKLDIVKQNVHCTKTLREKYIQSPETLKELFRPGNTQLIKDGANTFKGRTLSMDEIFEKQMNDVFNPSSAEAGNVYGFSWHHHEKMGKMELVPEGIHRNVKHTGGYIIWSK